MGLPPLFRDPRQNPRSGDRLVVGTEGSGRLVVTVENDEAVVWRYLGGHILRRDSLSAWRRDCEGARIVR